MGLGKLAGKHGILIRNTSPTGTGFGRGRGGPRGRGERGTGARGGAGRGGARGGRTERPDRRSATGRECVLLLTSIHRVK